MHVRNPSADIFIPDGKAPAAALGRVTHLGVGAHQDDLEFMAFHGIQACYHSDTDWFGGVTCTNGSGSSRTGSYAKYTDEEMMAGGRPGTRPGGVVGGHSGEVQRRFTRKDAEYGGQARPA